MKMGVHVGGTELVGSRRERFNHDAPSSRWPNPKADRCLANIHVLYVHMHAHTSDSSLWEPYYVSLQRAYHKGLTTIHTTLNICPSLMGENDIHWSIMFPMHDQPYGKCWPWWQKASGNTLILLQQLGLHAECLKYLLAGYYMSASSEHVEWTQIKSSMLIVVIWSVCNFWLVRPDTFSMMKKREKYGSQTCLRNMRSEKCNQVSPLITPLCMLKQAI